MGSKSKPTPTKRSRPSRRGRTTRRRTHRRTAPPRKIKDSLPPVTTNSRALNLKPSRVGHTVGWQNATSIGCGAGKTLFVYYHIIFWLGGLWGCYQTMRLSLVVGRPLSFKAHKVKNLRYFPNASC